MRLCRVIILSEAVAKRVDNNMILQCDNIIYKIININTYYTYYIMILPPF